MSERNVKCPYCNASATGQYQDNHNYIFVECPNCDRYEYPLINYTIKADMKDKFASYLYYKNRIEDHSDSRFYVFIGSQNDFEQQYSKYPWSHHASIAEVEAFYPKTFSERIDRILLGFAKTSQFFCDKIILTSGQAISAMFINRFNKNGRELTPISLSYQMTEIINYLVDNDYVVHSNDDNNHTFVIKPNGYKRIDELQATEAQTSKNVFIAMSFADEMKEVREAIKAAVFENGYIPRIMDEIEHNHQIVPEMLYEIRRARFVIAELTGHNNGAYFEAGYALGNGKEVIQVCRKDCFGTDGHFDVKQINTILWESTEELTKKLSDRIMATII